VWWDRAYLRDNVLLPRRFSDEASASLPGLGEMQAENLMSEDVFGALRLLIIQQVEGGPMPPMTPKQAVDCGLFPVWSLAGEIFVDGAPAASIRRGAKVATMVASAVIAVRRSIFAPENLQTLLPGLPALRYLASGFRA
jgi:hypothetical protein